MEARNRFIAPERMGAWVITALGVALVALIVAFFGIRESRVGSLVAQVEVINLNHRIKALEEAQAMHKESQPAAPQPAAPANK